MTTLAQYERARAALAEATRIDEVLPLLDEFELVKVRARQIQDQELLADATEFQMRAERRLGQVILAAKAAGLFVQGRQKKKAEKSTEPELSRPTLEEAGVTKKLSTKSQKRASIAEQAFELLVKSTREKIAAQNATPINGQKAVAPGRKEPKSSADFFPTPPHATRALIERVFPQIGAKADIRRQKVWEPACGAGHMAEVLCEYFGGVLASDLHEYGYGEAGVDFLKAEAPEPVDWIITNPPFNDLTEKFVLHALKRAKVGVAVFVRLQWLETIGRYERLFKETPPTLISFFCERINLCAGHWDPDGGTATAYIWVVWMKNRQPRAPYWIPPGCKTDLSHDDDRERFTKHPVERIEHIVCDEAFDKTTGEILPSVGASPSADTPEPVPVTASNTVSPAGTGSLSSEDDGLDIPEFLRRVPKEEGASA